MAIIKETRSPEIQHFPWASGKQLRSCTNLRRPPSSFCCAPTAGKGRLISQQLRPPLQTQLSRLRVQSGQLWRRIHGENSGVALGGSRRSPRSTWGHSSREDTSFSGPTAQGNFAAASLKPLMSAPALVSTLPFLGGDFSQSDLQRCPFMLRLMAGNPMATHSSTLAWKIPWTEEPGRLQSMGSRRVGHD